MLRKLALAAALTLSPVIAQAQTALWKQVGPWTVQVYRPDQTCSITQTFSRGTTFSVHYDRDIDRFGIAISNPAWTRYIKNDYTYDMRIELDGDPWNAKLTGIVDANNGAAALFMRGIKTKFIEDVMKKNYLRFIGTDRTEVTTLSLSGSWAAMLEWLECQKAMNESRT